MLLFHGTTVENAKNILKNGFNYENSIWNCSLRETYFFTETYLRANNDEDATREQILEYGLQEAFQQSLITLAIQNPKDYRGAVLVFDSELMNNKNQIEPDESCPNMSDRAVAVRNPDMKGLIGVYFMNHDFRSLRLFTLASMTSNEYLNEVDLPEWERSLMKSLESTYVDTSDTLANIEYTKQSPKKQQTNLRLLKAA